MRRLKSKLLSGANISCAAFAESEGRTIRKSGDSKLTDYLVAAAIGIGALVGAVDPSMAQSAPDCKKDPNNPACQVETVVVTGSRIPRPESDSPSPVVSVTSQEILHSGDVNLTDYLKRIPALVGSLGDAALSSPFGAITAAHASLEGLNLLDLRNLGYIRTLVLEDGQRVIASVPGAQAVDTNTIPITLIDRVDVETGGASAIYGADGVSGVVNFIMKHDLEGVDARFQVSAPENGHGNQYTYAASMGHNFDNGNGNITLTYEGFYQDQVFYTDIRDMRTGFHAFEEPNPANPLGTIPGLPANIPFKNLTIPEFGGTGTINALDGTTGYNGNGSAFNPGGFIDAFTGDSLGGDGLPLEAASFADFQPIEHRSIAEISGDDQFNRWFKVSGEFRFVNVNTKTAEENPFFETAITNQNAFLPANVAAAIAGNGTLGLGPQGSALGLLTAFPFEIPGTALTDKTSRNVYRGVIGLNGDLPLPEFFHDARYDVHYVYGQTDVSDTNEGDLVDDRLAASLDSIIDPATGKPTCRSNLFPGVAPADLSIFGLPVVDAILGFPTSLFGSTFTPGASSGCVPINYFDPHADNRAAIKFIYQSPTTTSVLTQQDLNGYASFDFPQVQDWGLAGPISMVIGGEWRQETSKSVSPPNTVAGFYGPGAPSPFFAQGGPEVAGRYHVTEGFGEMNIPVLAGKTLAQELSFDVAGRISDYSTAGTDETWKLDGVWSPVSGVKFRGTDAYAVRAPSIGELFSPQQVSFGFTTDPCDAPNVHAGTAFRVANCTAIMSALGVPYVAGSTITRDQVSNQIDLGGNADLKPETARTQTLGVVLQPDFIPDLTVTADWYRVNIRNAIEEPSDSDIAAQCVDLSSIGNPFCAQVTRTPVNIPGSAPPGGITLVKEIQLNVATFFTQGQDFTATYHANLDDWFGEHLGTLDFHLDGNHLDAFETTPLNGEAPVKTQNESSGGFDGGHAPDWQFNLDTLWTFDKWTVDYNILWLDSMLNITRQTLASEPNDLPANLLRTAPTNLHSIQISYEVADGWNAYVGVNNLWDQKPQYTHSTIPVDPFGRVYYAGLKLNLDPW
jgi:iron complex outermembrane receptor protein